MRQSMLVAVLATAFTLYACGGGGGGTAPPPGPTSTPNPQAHLYEPLATGDSWSYSCQDIKGGGENGGQPFTITDSVGPTTTVNGQTVYEFSLQIPQVPSSPLSIATQIQLLANDSHGNVTLYGYLVNGSVVGVTPTLFVSANPSLQNASFNYTAPNGSTIIRTFAGFFPTHPTKLGTFPSVADYEEGAGAMNNYGYAPGVGIAEEDHGPNNEVDCLITAFTLH